MFLSLLAFKPASTIEEHDMSRLLWLLGILWLPTTILGQENPSIAHLDQKVTTLR